MTACSTVAHRVQVGAGSTAAALSRGTCVTTGTTVAGVAAQIGTGAMTAAATTALAVRVTADTIGFTIGKGGTNSSQAKEAANGRGSDSLESLAA